MQKSLFSRISDAHLIFVPDSKTNIASQGKTRGRSWYVQFAFLSSPDRRLQTDSHTMAYFDINFDAQSNLLNAGGFRRALAACIAGGTLNAICDWLTTGQPSIAHYQFFGSQKTDCMSGTTSASTGYTSSIVWEFDAQMVLTSASDPIPTYGSEFTRRELQLGSDDVDGDTSVDDKTPRRTTSASRELGRGVLDGSNVVLHPRRRLVLVNTVNKARFFLRHAPSERSPFPC